MTRKRNKMICDNCGHTHNVSGIVFFKGKYLCWVCRPRVFDIPTTKTLQMLNKTKDIKRIGSYKRHG